MTRLVADEVAKSRTPYPYIDGLIFQITQNAGAVPVRHAGRGQGRSGYTFRKLVRLWMSMLVNFSVLPLRLMTLAGNDHERARLLAVIEVLLEHLLRRNPTGWSSLMAAILLLSGMQLLLLGIMGGRRQDLPSASAISRRASCGQSSRHREGKPKVRRSHMAAVPCASPCSAHMHTQFEKAAPRPSHSPATATQSEAAFHFPSWQNHRAD